MTYKSVYAFVNKAKSMDDLLEEKFVSCDMKEINKWLKSRGYQIIRKMDVDNCRCEFPDLGIIPGYRGRKEHESMYCFISSICQDHPDENTDLISVFTTSYKSGNFIYRPLKSLLAQTFQHWEWIILDDTDGDDNFQNMMKIKEYDPVRIRIYKSDGNSGIIGQVKNTASHLCRGSIIVELDHDDELLPDTLELIKKSFETYPDAGFLYSDFTEVFEDWTNFKYGQLFAHGFGSYRKEFHNNRWVNICSAPPMNDKTTRHIVGAPNHVRAWKADVFRQLGGYNTHLHVADDYELTLRTFLKTRMIRLPKFCYVQYRNQGGNNFTFIRNAEIQKHVKFISSYYHGKVHDRLIELGQPDRVHGGWTPDVTYWSHPNFDPHANYVADFFLPKNLVSVIIPTYNRPDLLKRAINSALLQTYQDIEIIVIGDKCPVMEDIMEKYRDTRIKWWNLETNDKSGGTAPRNYALKMVALGKFIAYLDDDNYWLPNHVESLMQCFEKNPEISYAFSSFYMGDIRIICKEPKRGRIDTSSIVHRAELLHKYGYWKRQDIVGYAHDWELVSRWKREKYMATGIPTLMYNVETCGQDPNMIYFMYDDQPKPEPTASKKENNVDNSSADDEFVISEEKEMVDKVKEQMEE